MVRVKLPLILIASFENKRRSNFWSNGLRLAWGNPGLLSKSDALRFQWPSIGKGWEKGLLAFTRSRLSSTQSYAGGEIHLFSDVLSLPNTSVVIASGTKDNIIPLEASQRLYKYFNDTGKVSFVEFSGCGHDPFEENPCDFIQKIQEVVMKK